MNEYQTEQWNALLLARQLLSRIDAVEVERLKQLILPYLEFRDRVDRFLNVYLGAHCTQSCYANSRSACCSKDGIIVFWADVAINMLCSDEVQRTDLEQALQKPFQDRKCTYLGARGCRWRVRPLVCAMFLCDPVRATVFQAGNDIEAQWKALRQRAQDFRWPDKPVLFDFLETYFMDLGGRSSLMHINGSPGLLRIKRQAGLCGPQQRQKP
ncbi:MAG: hypothetical protein HZB87_05880 [Desulfatitalea sp.]|nr:hypothetical protein [Desulfatitalea sp.]MBI5894732.1 hypothetical protein [Desulfobacterales bacterium]